jgi:hypothetical protein
VAVQAVEDVRLDRLQARRAQPRRSWRARRMKLALLADAVMLPGEPGPWSLRRGAWAVEPGPWSLGLPTSGCRKSRSGMPTASRGARRATGSMNGHNV